MKWKIFGKRETRQELEARGDHRMPGYTGKYREEAIRAQKQRDLERGGDDFDKEHPRNSQGQFVSKKKSLFRKK